MPTRPKTLSRALPQTRTRAERMVVAGIGGVCPCLRWEERSSGGRAFVPYNRGEQEECRDQSRFPKQKRKITNISRIYNYLTMNSTLDAKMSDTKDVQFSTPDFLRDLNSFLPVPSRQLRLSSSCLRKLRSTINTTTQCLN